MIFFFFEKFDSKREKRDVRRHRVDTGFRGRAWSLLFGLFFQNRRNKDA